VPIVLFGRFLRDRVIKRSDPWRVLVVIPAVLLLLAAWTAGEAAGAVAGRVSSATEDE
jgi:hypothetical protein